MLKYTIMFAAVAGLVLALAPAAQAVPVSNGGFESPWLAGGTQNSDPGPNWNTYENFQDCLIVDGRWKDIVGSPWPYYCAPTEGNQIMLLQDRSFNVDPTDVGIQQDLGTLNDLGVAGFPKIQLTFDARAGTYNNSDWAGETTLEVLQAFFTKNAVGTTGTGGSTRARDALTYAVGTVWMTDLGPTRKLHSWTEIGNAIGSATPGPSSAYMETFTTTVDTSLLNPATDVLGIAFDWAAIWQDGSNFNRISVDNVRVDGIPEPATMALLAFGGLGLLLRRRRR